MSSLTDAKHILIFTVNSTRLIANNTCYLLMSTTYYIYATNLSPIPPDVLYIRGDCMGRGGLPAQPPPHPSRPPNLPSGITEGSDKLK